MNKIAILLFSCLLLFSCQKESKNQYSFWQVGNDSFASNNVTIERIISPPRQVGGTVTLACNDNKNYFRIKFDSMTVLPFNGSYPLYNRLGTFAAMHVDIAIRYTPDTGTGYKIYIPAPSDTSKLSAYWVKGKAQLVLPPTWFVNNFDPADSTLIQGTFSAP